MMKTLRLIDSRLILLACLLLLACSPHNFATPTVTSTLPEAEVVKTETPAPTLTATVTLVPILTLTSEQPEEEPSYTSNSEIDLACGEVFCLVNWQGYLERPFDLTYRRMIDPSYPYGSTFNGMFDLHHGVEFPNGYGTPVLSAADGEVIFAGNDSMDILGPFPGFYGNVIILKHPGLYQGEDLYTLYAHLSELDVAVGAQVNSGEKIGEVGATGAADGPHLHFEVRLGENDYDHTTNPILWFSPLNDQVTEQSAALAGSLVDRYGQPLSEFDVVLEKLNADGVIEKRFYAKTYKPGRINAHPLLEENFVIPDVPPGNYRLSFIYGTMHQYPFTLEPGTLGMIVFQGN